MISTCHLGLRQFPFPRTTINDSRRLVFARASYSLTTSSQSDAAAAKSKAEATAAMEVEVLAKRENMRAELEKAEMTSGHNTLLQGLVLSESERRKKVRSEPLLWTIFRADPVAVPFSWFAASSFGEDSVDGRTCGVALQQCLARLTKQG